MPTTLAFEEVTATVHRVLERMPLNTDILQLVLIITHSVYQKKKWILCTVILAYASPCQSLFVKRHTTAQNSDVHYCIGSLAYVSQVDISR